jgi:ELWxxDGT repeat protein
MSIRIIAVPVVVIALLVAGGSAAQDYPPAMVRDINSTPNTFSSNPIEMVEMGGAIYFAATDEQYRGGLWRSDGTAEGTQLIKAFAQPIVYPDFSGGSGNRLVVVGDKLFFTPLETTSNISQLWVSDGSAAGTRQLNAPGAKALIAFGSYVYFLASGDLWRSDGTEAGTILVDDIVNATGDYESYPRLGVVGSRLFLMSQVSGGEELYVSDGNPNQARIIASYQSGQFGVSAVITTASTYYFVLNGNLYASDGSAAGTQQIYTSIGTGPVPYVRNLFASGNNLYFTDDRQLLVTTGSAATTRVLNPTVFNYNFSSEQERTTVALENGAIAFVGYSDEQGNELWRSDGTAEGTRLVADILPGTQSSLPSNMLVFDGKLYFSANDGQSGAELWVSDGTTAGTQQVRDIYPGPLGSTPRGGTASNIWSAYPLATTGAFYFAANDGIHGSELWRSDGTSAGTTLVKDLSPTGRSEGSAPDRFVAYTGGVVFTAYTLENGIALWASNGVERGTQLIYEGVAGPNSDYINQLQPVGPLIFFTSVTGNAGLYVTDGTPAGTRLLKAFAEPPAPLVPFGDGIAFVVGQSEIWASDGTVEGTRFLLNGFEITNTEAETQQRPYRGIGMRGSFAGRLLFSDGGKLYSSDGTAEGTLLLLDNGESFSSTTVPTSSRVYLSINDTLYVSNASATSLQPVRQFSGQLINQLTRFGERVLFKLNEQLWVSDGTEAGTWLVKNSIDGSNIAGVANGIAFLTGPSQLWVSDGSAAGTFLIRNFDAIINYPSAGTATNQYFAFVAFTSQGGDIWLSDGTIGGTFPLLNPPPGAHTISPENPIASGKFLFFTADDQIHGRELWATRIEQRTGDNPYPMLQGQQRVWLPMVE